MPSADEIRERILAAGFTIDDEQEVPHGVQLRLTNGAIVNCWDKGTFSFQGIDTAEVEAALQDMSQPPRRGRALRGAAPAQSAPRTAARSSDPEKVFVVYGHDADARTQLEAMLRRWNLEPLLLDQLPSEGQTIIEKLEATGPQAKFAVVLATPDDVGYAKDKESEKSFRARQNVVLELGMVLATLGRARVAILMKNATEMERPSDIQGLIYIPVTDNVSEAALPLAKEMVKQGFKIDVSRL